VGWLGFFRKSSSATFFFFFSFATLQQSCTEFAIATTYRRVGFEGGCCGTQATAIASTPTSTC
jgi:hypothetical protein